MVVWDEIMELRRWKAVPLEEISERNSFPVLGFMGKPGRDWDSRERMGIQVWQSLELFRSWIEFKPRECHSGCKPPGHWIMLGFKLVFDWMCFFPSLIASIYSTWISENRSFYKITISGLALIAIVTENQARRLSDREGIEREMVQVLREVTRDNITCKAHVKVYFSKIFLSLGESFC